MPLTRRLLWCGAVAGPLFVAVFTVAGAVRPDYLPPRHPVGSLALTGAGWAQTANFLVTGALPAALAPRGTDVDDGARPRPAARGRGALTWSGRPGPGPGPSARRGVHVLGCSTRGSARSARQRRVRNTVPLPARAGADPRIP
nr:DUF998 domain-containing protein [Nocardiopsis sp. TSRI0078]